MCTTGPVIVLLDTLHHLHKLNASRYYMAYRYDDCSERMEDLMPVSSFIHEYFIYNSIYQIDWGKTHEHGSIVNANKQLREMDKQKLFIDYLEGKVEEYGVKGEEMLKSAFSPLTLIPPATGDWTQIIPDHNLTANNGRDFFNDLLRIRQILTLPVNISQTDQNTFSFKQFINRNSMHYIYMIRNNIFHGSKQITRGNLIDQNQLKRILYYNVYLKAIVSLFFLTQQKSPVASEIALLPLYDINTTDTVENFTELISLANLRILITKSSIKTGDPFLIAMFKNAFGPRLDAPVENSAMFYPSAGTDFITPLVLSLPFCRDFYYYDHEPLGQFNSNRKSVKMEIFLRNIKTQLTKIDGVNQVRHGDWNTTSGEVFINFLYRGIERTLYWVHKDNKDFLDKDAKLTFYFHRGDSLGEGGSGQFWDSHLLPILMERVPSDIDCMFVTDGEPGGLASTVKKNALVFQPNRDIQRNYYYGILPKTL